MPRSVSQVRTERILTDWIPAFSMASAASSLIMNHARPLPNLLGQEHLRNAFAERLPDIVIPYVRNMAEAMALGEPELALTRRERDPLNRFLRTLLGAGASQVND